MRTKPHVEEKLVLKKRDRAGAVVLAAAFFRAAGIARRSDESTTDEFSATDRQDRNTLAIEQADRFLKACESYGLIVIQEEEEDPV